MVDPKVKGQFRETECGVTETYMVSETNLKKNEGTVTGLVGGSVKSRVGVPGTKSFGRDYQEGVTRNVHRKNSDDISE